jgi:hypothetical protein
MASIRKSDLEAASNAGLIHSDQVDALWQFLSARAAGGSAEEQPRFGFTHILYYLGGMLAIGAMSLFMPLAVTLWYMSMDIVPFLVGIHGDADSWFSGAAWELRKWISVAFGLIMMLIALLVDLRSRFTKDYAFWLYLFGLLAFWGGLSSMHSGALAGKLVYLTINVALILIGAILGRRAFAVFGGLGAMLVLGDISYRFFKDSWSFPIALTLIGFAIIGIGIWWQKHEAQLSHRLRALLPRDMRELIEARHAST